MKYTMSSLEDIISSIKSFIGEGNTKPRPEVEQYLKETYQLDQEDVNYVINALPGNDFSVQKVCNAMKEEEAITYRGENYVEKLPPNQNPRRK